MYSTLGVPLPLLGPDERARRRLAWRNERLLFRRKCDATGKLVVSIFDEAVPFPVYDQQHWWSDAWNPLAYGAEFDFSRPFFEQFYELFAKTPQCALRCPQSENSEFTNQCEKNKDCYLVFCSNQSRECMYGMWYQQCTNCLDCTYLEHSELCYEILNGRNCYRCTYSQNLENCNDCHFCRDLAGCSDCLGCVNLRNKQYCFFNEPLTPDAYRAAAAGLALHSLAAVDRCRARFAEFAARFPRKYYSGKSNEDSTGDYIENTKDANQCFNCRNSEHIVYCRDAWSARYCADLTETLEQDFCIALEGCYKTSNCGFSAKISETNDSWYCSHCFFSSDLFGCVSLKHRQHCILNVQYEKEEYESRRLRVIDHMKQTGEWGRYFPAKYSPFGYNQSVAEEYFPLNEAEARSRGFCWKNTAADGETQSTASIPDSVREVLDDILGQVIVCPESKRSFKLQKPELQFYRKMDIPLPREHPDVRQAKRMARRNPRVLWPGKCGSCGQSLETTYAPQDQQLVFCEECYRKSVI